MSRAEIVLGYSLGFGFFATIQVAIVLAFVLGRFDIPALGPIPEGGEVAEGPLVGPLEAAMRASESSCRRSSARNG